MGDRSGSREPKLSSLKKSKKNPGAPAGRTKRERKVEPTGPSLSAPPPLPSAAPYFDCAMAILSRQFDRDRDKVLERARNEGVCAILCWFSDIEKLDILLETCKSNSGLCYLLAGIHPDNIERTNKKSHEGWIHKVEDIARQPVCLGILSGLNLSREIGTHFAQESLLSSACGVADRLLLPIVLHIAADGSSLERAIEILRGEGWTADTEAYIEAQGRRRVILHDAVTACGTDVSKIKLALDAGFYFIFSAAGITDPDAYVREHAAACVAAVPCTRMLSASDSPWRTPQNHPDTYIRTLRNEPSNIKSVIEALAAATSEVTATTDTQGMSIREFEVMLRSNAITVFGLDSIADIVTTSCVASDGNVDDVNSKDHNNVNKKLAVINESEEEIAAAGMVRRRKDKNKKGKGQTRVSDEDYHEDAAADDDEDEDDVVAEISDARSGTSFGEGVAITEEGGSSVTSTAAAAAVGAQEVEALTDSEPYFGCLRCRCRLFTGRDVTSHGLGATRTVFKVGEEGLCTAAVFVSCVDVEQLTKTTKLSVMGNTVECQACGCKLGKFSNVESTCPCGALVSGPAARIITSKVDYFDGNQDTATLLARMHIEAEEAHLEADRSDGISDKQTKKDKKKKKISRLDNRGNFSNFRNKSFVPNASRSANKKASETVGGVGSVSGGGGLDQVAVEQDEEEEDEEEVGRSADESDEEEEEEEEDS